MTRHRPLTGLELGDVWMIARACYEAAHAALCAFIEEMKDGDFIADALVRHGIDGARLAPKAV